MVGVGERDAADAVLVGEFDRTGHGCPCIEVAGSAAAVPAFDGAELVQALRGGLHIDGAVADHREQAGEALQTVRVDAVACGLGKETGAEIGAMGLKAGADENGGEGGCDFVEGNAEHHWRGFRSSSVVGMSSATVGWMWTEWVRSDAGWRAYMAVRMQWTASSPPVPKTVPPRMCCVSASTRILM